MNPLIGTIMAKSSSLSTYSTATTSSVAEMTAVVGMMSAFMVPMLIVAVLLIVAQWKIFTKAGEAGWKSIIPVYNLITLYKIIGLSPWLILIFLVSWIPVVGQLAVFALAIVQNIKLAKVFGQSTGFAVGLILLGPIFQLILAFGNAEYVGPETTNA